MDSVRIGIDKRVLWAIYRQDSPEDFSNASDIRVYIEHSSFPVIRNNVPFSIIGNVIDAYIAAELCPRVGDWRIYLEYTKENSERPFGVEPFIIDKPLFKQVNFTEDESVEDGFVESVSLSSIMDRAKDGIDGATFTPTIIQTGKDQLTLTWNNDKGLDNPPDIVFKSNVTFSNGYITIDYGINS